MPNQFSPFSQFSQITTSQPATHGGSVSGQDLRLCLHRLHGRQVQAMPVSMGSEGLTLGADSDLFATGAAHDLFTAGTAQNHCIAKLHGVIRPHPSGWWLEPGTKDVVLALNNEKIAWGDGRLLHPGDRIDLGFASLLVEKNNAPPRLLHTTPVTQSVRDIQELQDVQQQKTLPPTSEQASPEQASPLPVVADMACPADELCALLAEDARNSTSRDALQYAVPHVQSTEESPLRAESGFLLRGHADDFGPALVPMPVLAPQFDPNDPLAALAAESTRVLACGGDFRPTHNMAMAHQQAGRSQKQSMPEYPLKDLLENSLKSPLENHAPAASLEDILEGPLSIDHVLDKLRSGHGHAGKPHSGELQKSHNSLNPQGSQGSLGSLDSLAEHERTPDPLLLLAGMETQILREPELAPVLHKEHRTTNLHTAYTFSVKKDETIQEAPWPDHKA